MSAEISLSFIVISVVLSTIVLCTMVGNVFVIVAILVDKNLQTSANQLVLSLAVADLMVACLVMPLGAYNDLYQGWFLGKEVCEFWTSADVLCCTASILNLLAIALDRYWAVTSVDYIYKRTKRRMNMMILYAWMVGTIVSLAPIFGWKDPEFAERVLVEHKCMVSQDVAYQVFATISTFYAPLVLLLALYWRIFKVARKRIRRKAARNVTTSLEQASQGLKRETMVAGGRAEFGIDKFGCRASSNLSAQFVAVEGFRGSAGGKGLVASPSKRTARDKGGELISRENPARSSPTRISMIGLFRLLGAFGRAKGGQHPAEGQRRAAAAEGGTEVEGSSSGRELPPAASPQTGSASMIEWAPSGEPEERARSSLALELEAAQGNMAAADQAEDNNHLERARRLICANPGQASEAGIISGGRKSSKVGLGAGFLRKKVSPAGRDGGELEARLSDQIENLLRLVGQPAALERAEVGSSSGRGGCDIISGCASGCRGGASGEERLGCCCCCCNTCRRMQLERAQEAPEQQRLAGAQHHSSERHHRNHSLGAEINHSLEGRRDKRGDARSNVNTDNKDKDPSGIGRADRRGCRAGRAHGEPSHAPGKTLERDNGAVDRLLAAALNNSPHLSGAGNLEDEMRSKKADESISMSCSSSRSSSRSSSSCSAEGLAGGSGSSRSSCSSSNVIINSQAAHKRFEGRLLEKQLAVEEPEDNDKRAADRRAPAAYTNNAPASFDLEGEPEEQSDSSLSASFPPSPISSLAEREAAEDTSGAGEDSSARRLRRRSLRGGGVDINNGRPGELAGGATKPDPPAGRNKESSDGLLPEGGEELARRRRGELGGCVGFIGAKVNGGEELSERQKHNGIYSTFNITPPPAATLKGPPPRELPAAPAEPAETSPHRLPGTASKARSAGAKNRNFYKLLANIGQPAATTSNYPPESANPPEGEPRRQITPLPDGSSFSNRPPDTGSPDVRAAAAAAEERRQGQGRRQVSCGGAGSINKRVANLSAGFSAGRRQEQQTSSPSRPLHHSASLSIRSGAKLEGDLGPASRSAGSSRSPPAVPPSASGPRAAPLRAPTRSLDIRRKFKALGQLVSFVATNKGFNSSASSSSARSSGSGSGVISSERRKRFGRAAASSNSLTTEPDWEEPLTSVFVNSSASGHTGELHPNPQRTASARRHPPGSDQHALVETHKQEERERGCSLTLASSLTQVDRSGRCEISTIEQLSKSLLLVAELQEPLQRAPQTTRSLLRRHQQQIESSAGEPNHTSGSKNSAHQLITSTSGSGSGPSKRRLSSGAQAGQASSGGRRQRENLEIRREKKAAKTLAIITGVFVCCWLPFFLNAIIMPICGPACTPSDLILSILLWLGYLNSLLNPIIYTIFSPDFRRAFRRLLCWPELLNGK